MDGHRAAVLLVSPYIDTRVDSRFYNSANLVRTLRGFVVQGPDAAGTASPMAVFGKEPSNDDPYLAK